MAGKDPISNQTRWNPKLARVRRTEGHQITPTVESLETTHQRRLSIEAHAGLSIGYPQRLENFPCPTGKKQVEGSLPPSTPGKKKRRTYGRGSKIDSQNGTLVNGTQD